jgi:hypothetical protein
MAGDVLERCVKELGDRRACEFMYRVFRTVEELRLEECVAKNGIDRCLDACMERCKDGDCDRLCDHAVGQAAATVTASVMLLEAAGAAVHAGADLLGLLAVRFVAMLEGLVRGLEGCHQKRRLARLFSMVAVELAGLVGTGEPLLLVAPALASARGCIEDQVDGVLSVVRLIAGDEYAARIAAALEEGAVEIGSVVVRFRPLRQAG